MEMSETPKFKVGDRAVVNAQFDELALDRDRLIGSYGVISDVVPEDHSLLFFKADNPDLDGWGPDGSWAVLDYELDKING